MPCWIAGHGNDCDSGSVTSSQAEDIKRVLWKIEAVFSGNWLEEIKECYGKVMDIYL